MTGMKKATILAAELLAAVIICSSCSSKYEVGEIGYPFAWNLWIFYGNPNQADADKDEIIDLILSAPPAMAGGKSNGQQVMSACSNHKAAGHFDTPVPVPAPAPADPSSHQRITRIYFE